MKHSWKKTLAFISAFAIVAAPIAYNTAGFVNNDYAVTVNAEGDEQITAYGITFETEWSSTDSLPSETGNYYLTNDITITEAEKKLSLYTKRGKDVKIYLNDHSITYDNSSNLVEMNGANTSKVGFYGGKSNSGNDNQINICHPESYLCYMSGDGEQLMLSGVQVNCVGNGIITNGNGASYTSAGVYLNEGSKLTCTTPDNESTGVSIGNGFALFMNGGTIDGFKGNAVVLNNNSLPNRFYVKEDSTINGTITVGNGRTIAFDSGKKLTGSPKIKMTTAPEEGSPVAFTNENGAATNFKVADDVTDYTVSKHSDGIWYAERKEAETINADPSHYSYKGINLVFDKEWTATDSLPTTPGNYYLSGDVVIDNVSNRMVNPQAGINIYLNGHSIAVGGTVNYIIWWNNDSNDSKEVGFYGTGKDSEKIYSKTQGKAGFFYSNGGKIKTVGLNVEDFSLVANLNGGTNHYATLEMGVGSRFNNCVNGVSIGNGSKLVMNGGEISNSTGYGVALYNDSRYGKPIFEVSADSTIDDIIRVYATNTTMIKFNNNASLLGSPKVKMIGATEEQLTAGVAFTNGAYGENTVFTSGSSEHGVIEDASVWKAIKTGEENTVSFHIGDTVTEQKVVTNGLAEKLANPDADHVYEYYADEAFETPYDFTQAITSNTDIYVKTEAVKYFITYMKDANTEYDGLSPAKYSFGEETALPKSVDGYKVKWHAAADLSDEPVSVLTAEDKGNKIYYAELGADVKTDLSTAAIAVDTEKKSVTVTADKAEVPAEEYALEFFSGEESIGSEFPTEPGTYYVVVTAKDTSESFTGSLKSDEFTIAKPKTDLSNAAIAVNTVKKSVTLTADKNKVPAAEYTLEFFSNKKSVGSEFPTEPGTYYAVATAKDTSESFTGSLKSDEFTIAKPKTDLSKAAIAVDTEKKSVTVTADKTEVPAAEYTVEFFADKKSVGSEFPTEPGTYYVVVTAKNTSESFTGTLKSEEFTVKDILWGDSNLDGVVNVRDCAYTAKCLANKKQDILPREADFNRDGEKDIRDAAATAKYLADIAKEK